MMTLIYTSLLLLHHPHPLAPPPPPPPPAPFPLPQCCQGGKGVGGLSCRYLAHRQSIESVITVHGARCTAAEQNFIQTTTTLFT